MTISQGITREHFINCEFHYEALPEKNHGYFYVMTQLKSKADEYLEQGQVEHASMFEMLSRATSMMLTPDSQNEPFKPYFQDFQEGKRSAKPEDFSIDDLVFIESILNDVEDIWLKARLADLLWLLRKPKILDHANTAIEAYISNPIDPETWLHDVNDCWNRAAYLARQIRNADKLNEIKDKILLAFRKDYPTSAFMSLWLAEVLDKHYMDDEFRDFIAQKLFEIGNAMKSAGDFHAARQYFELAEKKYRQCDDEANSLNSLVAIAECFELEADSKLSESNLAANIAYENAMQAYRRIPSKHRDAHGVNDKIQSIRKKISETGLASLDEMVLIKTPEIDITPMIESSISHVKGKKSLEETLLYFTGLYQGPKIIELTSGAKKNIQEHPLSNLFGSNHMSEDGRVVARTPAANLGSDDDEPANQVVLNHQIQQQFAIEVQLVVKGQILPALRQILFEHRVTKEFMEIACQYSPIVPRNREQLLGYALWLGFEYNFGNAIYLLCPQLEHIVRTQLKDFGAQTSNINPDGIDTEISLKNLMSLPEANQLFGDDLVFEIKSVFTDSLGFNLRNEVAHGLLSDRAASSFQSIYAWWMVVRIVIRSISARKKTP